MMIIGLTGGIGSGKSTVAKMFEALDVPVYDSDIEAKSLMVSSIDLKERIIDLLGTNAYKGKKLNKTHIANKVFNEPELLLKLNQIVHPAVKNHFFNWTESQSGPYVIQESALIFENNSYHKYDEVILVTAPKEQRIQRVMDRDGTSREKVLERISNQLEDAEKVKKADYVIENIVLDDTRNSVHEIHRMLLNKRAHQ